MKKIATYLISILLVEALGFTVGMLTRTGTEIYAGMINKPPLSPPGILFPIAWTILYALMGVGVARIILSGQSYERRIAVILFAAQLVLNLAWCFIFFGAQKFMLAFVELIIMLALVMMMIIFFRKTDTLAAMLQIPYIMWLCFAAYLNLGVVVLN
ncbi:MAG: tryptophan-rich sensory protein [Butyrivibrio sp.]|nr:tryptophan-rich sensory protein [Butyrivibrio sp.]